MIVHQDTGKVRPDVPGDHRLRAPPGMGVVKRPLRVGRAMQPMGKACDVDAGLVAVQHAGMEQLGDQFLFELLQ